MKIPGIFRKKAKRYFLGMIFLVGHFYTYSQGCGCPPIAGCAPCAGGLISLTFRYNGFLLPALVTAEDGNGPIQTFVVPSGGTFTVTGSMPDDKFASNFLNLRILGFVNASFATNCGTPVFVGSDFGDFTVMAGQSKGGGAICCEATDMDLIPPVISGCPTNRTVSLSSGCTMPVNWTAPTATDNCGPVALTSTHNPGSIFSKGTTLVTYMATDDYGNTTTCSFNVTVNDAINPVIAGCPSNIIISANASCQAIVNWTAPTASDNCAAVALTTTQNPGTVFNLGTTPVTYTATDAAGNISTCSFNVTVQDNTNPVITGCPSNITVSADASCQATVNWTAPTVSDNCGGTLTLTSTKNPGTIFTAGTTVVTYTATDAVGNTSTCSFNVIVQDNTNPLISGCPSNITVSANASCQATVNWTAPTVSDNCGGTLTLTTTKNPGTLFNLGTTLVTYTATDAAGNTSACSFNVTVQDNTNPVITGCPSNITVSANASCQATVNWTVPTVTDNCGGTLTLTATKNPGTIFNLGTTIVTYTAADAAGNTSTCSFNVIVQDNTNPVIAGCPSNITVSANAACQATVNWTAPTVSDNCGGTLTLTSTKNPGTVFNLGTTVVTYTASDAVGNISTCSFNVLVQDNTNPVITGCPSTITVNANGSCQANVNWIAPIASDNCTSVTLTTTKNPGTVFNLGTTVVTYTATDAALNTSTCSFNVVVLDNTIPVITGCPSNITVSANASCNATVNWTAPSASDNCGGTPTLTTTKNPGTVFNLGTTVVTYTATDAAGNFSTCSFNVIVQDNTGPLITGCPSNITVSANGTCQATVSWTAPTISDNCAGGLSLTPTKLPGTVFNLGTTVVTYTATDAAGNTSTCSFNVLVRDDTNPTITGCPSDITVTADVTCHAVVSWTLPAVSDNCNGANISSTVNPGTPFDIGTTVVTYTATDVSGNISTCSFNVIVQDNTSPVITGCPSNITISANASCQATVNWTAPTVSDNCGAILTPTKNPGAIFAIGTTVVTYTATDVAGNASTCSFSVIVVDDTSPTIACPSNIIVSANASCQAAVNWTVPTASDNCGGPVTLTSTNSPGSIFPLGSTMVTYTATDVVGNVSTCSFAVIVEDNTAPQISGCSDVIVSAGSTCKANASWTAPVVADCSSVTITSSHNVGDIFDVGTTPVTYTATDNRGNTSTCSFNVIVEDKTSPVFANCPGNVAVTVNNSCESSVSWNEPIASDNCDVTVTKSHEPGAIFPAGTTPVKYLATDARGNQSVCEFTVTVKVVDIPVFSYCPENIQTKSNENGEAIVDWALPTATTACSAVPLTLTSSHQPGNAFPIGTTTVKYKAEDPFGNAGYCQFEVQVIQTEIELDISRVVTPDGNTQNDEWIVNNIEKFKDNKVVIVDRWGSVIYTASGYNNESVVWNGSNRQGSLVPTGTYFYTISVRYGPSMFEKTGFVELIR